MLLTRQYPEMPIPPKRIVQINRCLSDRQEIKQTAAPFPHRIRLSAEQSIARGEYTRAMLIDGIRLRDIATIVDLCGYCASLENPMSVTNARKHLNKLIAAGKVERSEDNPRMKRAILYWLADDAS